MTENLKIGVNRFGGKAGGVEFKKLRGTSIETAPQHDPVLTCLCGQTERSCPVLNSRVARASPTQHAPSFTKAVRNTSKPSPKPLAHTSSSARHRTQLWIKPHGTASCRACSTKPPSL